MEETVSQRIEVDKLHQAIAQLPEKQRRRLVLYYFGEFTYEQIAEMEGCTKRAVKFSVDIALKNLKEIFSDFFLRSLLTWQSPGIYILP